MRIKTPETGFSVYLDDRLLFAKGFGPVAPLAVALEYRAHFEACYQPVDNKDKRAFFGKAPSVRRRLLDRSGKLPMGHVNTLGVACFFKGRCAAMGAGERIVEATHRARRIACAGGSAWVWRLTVQASVISMFKWVGAWQPLAKCTFQSWAAAVGRALLRRPARGRNRYLMWS